jgi:bifunctional DNA-binding transcriptional regulator/antitoxin component of YhaV-PrlF toxin-antitoxin module
LVDITLSGKNEIMLPVEIVQALGLRPGDKLVAELVEDRIVLLPRPESWTDYFKGSMKGVYGPTKEEVDRYIAEVRYGRERDEWFDHFDSLMVADRDVCAVVEALKSSYQCKGSPGQLQIQCGLSAGKVRGALEKLVEHGGVRRIPLEEPEIEVYRLVHELAER